MKYKHYAPSKPLYLVEKKSIFKEVVKTLRQRKRVAALCSQETCEDVEEPKIILGTSENLYTVAKNLFKSFRELDSIDVEMGVMEPFPEKGIGLAIMNRAKKASAHIIIHSVEEARQIAGN